MERELESRFDHIENELKDIKMMLRGLDTHKCEAPKKFPVWPNALPAQPAGDPMPWLGGGDIAMRKPIMYFYNFTGDTLNCNVDFKSNIVIDSVPEIRKDNKIVFSLDSDSFINDKYGYLYYEFDITGNEPKSSSYTFIRNNKGLDYDLERLANCLGFNQKEATDFIAYWDLELKRLEAPFFKCEIFDETKLEKLFPIEIDPVPNFLARRYVKFVPVDKMGKGNITAEQFKPKARMGALRVFEWGGYIAGGTSMK